MYTIIDAQCLSGLSYFSVFLLFGKRLTEFHSRVQGSVKLPKDKIIKASFFSLVHPFNHTCVVTQLGPCFISISGCAALWKQSLIYKTVHFSTFGSDQLFGVFFIMCWKLCVLQLTKRVKECDLPCNKHIFCLLVFLLVMSPSKSVSELS